MFLERFMEDLLRDRLDQDVLHLQAAVYHTSFVVVLLYFIVSCDAFFEQWTDQRLEKLPEEEEIVALGDAVLN